MFQRPVNAVSVQNLAVLIKPNLPTLLAKLAVVSLNGVKFFPPFLIA